TPSPSPVGVGGHPGAGNCDRRYRRSNPLLGDESHWSVSLPFCPTSQRRACPSTALEIRDRRSGAQLELRKGSFLSWPVGRLAHDAAIDRQGKVGGGR